MKPIDVKSDSYVKYNVDSNENDPKYKNIFAKENNPHWSKEVFVISKIKNTVPWTCY